MTHGSTCTRRVQPIFAVTLAAALLVRGVGQSLELTSIDPPAPPGSTSPALAAEDPTTLIKEHEILMTWLEPGAAGGRLRFAPAA